MAIVDMFAKASMMPYVNCRGVTITRHPAMPDNVKNIKLNLEILQSKQSALKSSWLNDFAANGVKFLDAMFLQIVPFYRKENVLKLRAAQGSENNYSDLVITYDPDLGTLPRVPSVYLSQQFLGDGYLPRGHAEGSGVLSSNVSRAFNGWHPGLFAGQGPESYFDALWVPYAANLAGLSAEMAEALSSGVTMDMWAFSGLKSPRHISMDSVIGNISSAKDIVKGGLSGTIKEEVRHGIEYYVIPFEVNLTHPGDIAALMSYRLSAELAATSGDPVVDAWAPAIQEIVTAIFSQGDVPKINNLGFLFYTFLDIPYYFNNLTEIDLDESKYSDFFESLIVEGPINTEIVYLDGEIVKEREQFRLPNNEIWLGPAHLHLDGKNPSPAGYSGPGGYGHNKGWMAGEKHIAGLPRLSLELVENDMIVDFSETHGKMNPPDNVLGLGTKDDHSIHPHMITSVEQMLSPFQKETRKYLRKLDVSPTNAGGHVLYDNDDEYSKLYICHGSDGAARGTFIIDFKRLLKNNSHLFPLINTPDLERDILTNHSKLLELRLYRDRVKKKPLVNVYENYANDTLHEEASKFIGAVSDTGVWGTAVQTAAYDVLQSGDKPANQGLGLGSGLLSLGGGSITTFSTGTENTTSAYGIQEIRNTLSTDLTVRTFSFVDTEVGDQSAGHYRYRVELSFLDGTYQFLVKKMNILSEMAKNLNMVHNFQLSSFAKDPTVEAYPGGALANIVDKYENSFPVDQEELLSFGAVYKRKRFKRYYNNGSFADEYKEHFGEKFGNRFTANFIKHYEVLIETMKYFFVEYSSAGKEVKWNQHGHSTLIYLRNALMSAYYGTTTVNPETLNYSLDIIQTIIQKLEDLTGITKVNKTGSELADLTASDGYQLQNAPNVIVSPSKSMIEEDYTFDHPSEIFRTDQSNNMYVDYLSVGTNKIESSLGLNYMTAAQYIARCILDTAKYSDAVQNLTLFADANMAAGISPSGPIDSFSNSGYTFLTPSIVGTSDPLHALGLAKEHKYSVFDENTTLDTQTITPWAVLSADYQNLPNYEKVYLSLFRNSVAKKEYENTQVTTPILIPNDLHQLTKRELYKGIFSDIGLTVHSAAKYETFYDKPPGAVSQTPTNNHESADVQYNELFGTQENPVGLSLKNFSDMDVMTDKYYKYFMFNNSHIGIDDCLASPYQIHDFDGDGASAPLHSAAALLDYQNLVSQLGAKFPNNFKMSIYANKSGTSTQIKSFFNSRVQNSPPSAAASAHAGFMFFHMNLTAKIEVFDPSPSLRSPLKEDRARWAPLHKEHIKELQSSEVLASHALFCRISFYDENLVKGLDLPIVDRYFNIVKG